MKTFSRLALIVLVVLVAFVIVAPYIFLPGILESAAANNLQDRLGLREKPDVSLASDPPLGMLSGEFDEGRVEMDGFDIGDGIEADWVAINLEPFDVNVLDSATSGDLKTEEPISGEMEVELSERDVLEIARSRVQDFPVRDVELEEGRALVASEVELLGFMAPVSVEGGLDPRGDALVFTPRTVEAFGVPLPGEVTEALLGGTDFEYPLSGLPYDASVTDLSVEKDRMTMFGEVEGVALG